MVATEMQASAGSAGGNSLASSAGPVFDRMAVEGALQITDLQSWLAECSPQQARRPEPAELDQLVQSVAGAGAKSLSKAAALAVLGLLQSAALAAQSSSLASGVGTSSSSPARAPLKSLSKNRSYLETGTLAYDDAVLSYLTKLDEHRRKCEAEGRYQEARAAALRLQDLKTAQVARLRQELMTNQTKELQEVHHVYDEETLKFTAMWDNRVTEYESNFRQAVEAIKTAHEQQRSEYIEELLNKRPTKPKPSREYLQQRSIEVNLAKTRQYLQAVRVKEAADELYASELEQTQATFEAEQRLKVAKYTSKQQQEFEALLQRAARGRDELELRRQGETEKRLFRFRNVVAELESLHRLEVVQLENFLDAQVQAGKAVPLKDDSAFRRKRNELFGTTF